MHDGITDHGELEDVGHLDLRFVRHIRGESVECAAHCVRHLLRAARVHHRVGHAAHEVFAETDLRIHGAARCHHFAALEVAEVGGDGGRADIHRQPVGTVVESGPHADQLISRVHGDRDAPCALAQGRLQLLQHLQIRAQRPEVPFLVERLEQPLQITGRVVHVRLAHFHVVQVHERIHGDGAGVGSLAHHLAMHLAARRHVDDEIAEDLRGAGEAVPRGKRPTFRVALFHRAQR